METMAIITAQCSLELLESQKKHERLVPGVGWGWNFLGQIQVLAGIDLLRQIHLAPGHQEL